MTQHNRFPFLLFYLLEFPQGHPILKIPSLHQLRHNRVHDNLKLKGVCFSAHEFNSRIHDLINVFLRSRRFANDIFAPEKNQMVGENRLFRHRSRAFYWRKCKTKRGETNIDSLPDELLLEILARLSDDPDYLYNKGRLVCRRWCHLIHSHDFIKTQLHRSTYGLLFCSGDHAAFVTATQGRIETSEISYKVPPHSKLRSSCNGLVLHQHREMPVMSVTNPVTRQQFVLPPLFGKKMIRCGCGIGYAADSMEYKVAAPYLTTDRWQEFLSILSVGRDKSWRRVGVEHLSIKARSLLCDFPLVTNESFIMWPDFHSGRYLTLDVETEILTLHPRPIPEACPVRTKWIYLSTGRSLSLLVVHNNTKYLMELWEMMAETGEWRKVVDDIKLGAQERWLRQFSVGGSGSLMPLLPFGWVRYPEVLAFFPIGCRSTCIFFNLNTQQISSMELPRSGYFYPHAHKKNLTWFWP